MDSNKMTRNNAIERIEDLQYKYLLENGDERSKIHYLHNSKRELILDRNTIIFALYRMGILPDKTPDYERIVERRYQITLEELEIRDKHFSKYEPPFYAAILWRLFNQIKKVSFLHQERVDKIILGTLPLGHLNARVFKLESDYYAILYNIGLFNSISILSKILIDAIPLIPKNGNYTWEDDLEKIASAVKANKVANDRFLEFMNAYFVHGNPEFTGFFSVPQYYNAIHEQVYHSGLLFILAHEISHIELDHIEEDYPLNNLDKWANVHNYKFSDFNYKNDLELLFNWNKEFLTDRCAIIKLLRIYKETGSYSIYFFLGVFLFLDFTSIINFLIKKDIISNTHPPSKERKNRIFQFLKTELPDDEIEIVYYANISSVVVNTMFETNKHAFKFNFS